MSSAKKSKHKGGNLTPALCSILGILILVAVIASYLPMSIPRIMGLSVYNIVSGSMEPTIPVNSVIYVRWEEPSDIEEGDVIAFYRDEGIVAHRVVSNEEFNSRFVTKGDANESEDMNTVSYNEVIGVVTHHIPYLGPLMTIYSGTAGKIYALMFAACGAMLLILAGRIRAKRRSEVVEEYLREHSGKDGTT